MKLMTTKSGDNSGVEYHINNWFIGLIFIAVITAVQLSTNLPIEEEPTYSHVVCT